jgi:hypothetical protein
MVGKAAPMAFEETVKIVDAIHELTAAVHRVGNLLQQTLPVVEVDLEGKPLAPMPTARDEQMRRLVAAVEHFVQHQLHTVR